MFESSTRAFARSSYTVDLAGLFAHARDTLAAYATAAAERLAAIRAERPRDRLGTVIRSYAEHKVPDYMRFR